MTTPSVPSLPMTSWRRSGPAAERGVSRVRTTLPSGSTTSSASTTSSIEPYAVENCPAARVATQPPTVESSTDCGQ